MLKLANVILMVFFPILLVGQNCDSSLTTQQKEYLLDIAKKYPLGLTESVYSENGRWIKRIIIVKDSISCAEEFRVEKKRFKRHFYHNNVKCSKKVFWHGIQGYYSNRKKALGVSSKKSIL